MSAPDAKTAGGTWGERAYREWERFWFQPADPTKLALIRICCGLITLYSMIACSFDLQNFVGENGWIDLATIQDIVRDEPVLRQSLKGNESPLAPPSSDQEKRYLDLYLLEFKELPPGPYPHNDVQMMYCHRFRDRYGYDLRRLGLPPPSTEEEQLFLEEFANVVRRPDLNGYNSQFFNQPPAAPYPATAAERKERLDYAARYGVDPRRLLYRGQPIWSLFFHVTDPHEIWAVHLAAILVTFLFTIGLGTRLTSVLTWFFYLNYAHRNFAMLFGVDVMTNIVLIYLMIGPSGAALSVDRLLARWWSVRKPAVINRWRRLWGKGPLDAEQLATSPFAPRKDVLSRSERRQTEQLAPAPRQAEPESSVGANFAVRLLQVHLCIIYFVSGVSKLMGPSWWNGTAVWGTLANFEMAPMQFKIYNVLLRFLSHNEVVFSSFLIAGTYFTLAFEIGYAFLIWRPRLRRVYLAAALLLHGMIGVTMGLTTFALMMVVMNMAFLTDEEAHWLAEWPGRWRAWLAARRPPREAALQKAPSTCRG